MSQAHAIWKRPNPIEYDPTSHKVIVNSLPKGWRGPRKTAFGFLFEFKNDLKVILTIDRQRDERVWLHVSFSHADRIPSYETCKVVKELFFGPDLWALQVFPKTEEHVNIHAYCLHLWYCFDEPNLLPDFRPMPGML